MFIPSDSSKSKIKCEDVTSKSLNITHNFSERSSLKTNGH